MLAIVGDHGKGWSYRWPVQHLGHPTLTDAIRDGFGKHYIMDKLCRLEEKEAYDCDRTIRFCRDTLLQERRAGWGDPATARELWDELGDLSEIESEAIEQLEHLPLFQSSSWEYTCHSPTVSALHLRDVYIPALKAHLRSLVPTLSTVQDA